MDLSERIIIPTLDYYVELLVKQAEFDRLTLVGQAHDVAEFLGVVYDLPEIESALLAAGCTSGALMRRLPGHGGRHEGALRIHEIGANRQVVWRNRSRNRRKQHLS